MKQRWHALAICAGVVALAFVVARADPSRLAMLLQTVGVSILWAWVPPIGAMATQAQAWRLLGRDAHRGLRFTDAFLITIAAQAQRVALPAGAAIAEAYQAAAASRCPGNDGAWHEGAMRWEDAVASVAAKKALTWLSNGILVAAAAISLVLAISVRRLPSNAIPVAISLVVAAIVLSATGGVLVLAMRWRRLFPRTRVHLARIRSRRIRHWLARTADSWQTLSESMVRVVERPRSLVTPLCWLTLSWALEVGHTWLLLRLLGVSVPLSIVLVFEVSAALLRSLAFLSPGGLGAQDLGYLGMFEMYHLPHASNVAAAFVLLKRLQELSWVALGWVAFGALRTTRPSPP